MKSNTQYRDIILVLDISGSMSGQKLKELKNSAYNLINTILSNSNNRMALITFGTTSQIVDNLTNDKGKLIESINNLTESGNTNYYQALVNIDNILKNYEKEEERKAIALFVTDGYPNEDTPNEIGQYSYLKKQYPFLTINGIQYEMGTTALALIKKVTDNQYMATMNDLSNIFYEASEVPINYETFNIIDYIDDSYFKISNSNKVNVSIGKADLGYEETTPKVNWVIEEGQLKSGAKATMTIDIELKDEYLDRKDIYLTNKKTEVISTLKTNPDENVISPKTTVIADNYVVRYEENAPLDCKITGVPENEKHSVFETVAKSDVKPTCGAYQFKGWEIVTKGVTRVNDDYFIMPEKDVILRAIWGSLSITKSMDGEVSKTQTLYKIMSDNAVPDNVKSKFVESDTGIDYYKIASDTNGKGVYQLSSTKEDDYPVYYYRGDVKNNNVKFADICWKAVRTTSTGGVKLIYNGAPTVEGKCTNTVGDKTDIGDSYFNLNRDSPAYNGYMYGTVYPSKRKTIPSWYNILEIEPSNLTIINNEKTSYYNSYYYGDTITWDGSNYILSNSDGSEITQKRWGDNYSSLKGKYRCVTGSQTTCTEVYYLVETYSPSFYYLNLTNGQLLDNINIEVNFGKNITYENGKYTINDPKAIKKAELLSKKSEYENKGYYMCTDGNTNCTEINYVLSIESGSLESIKMNNGTTYNNLYEQAKNIKWIYGNDISWNGTSYTLTNTIESSIIEWESEKSKIGKGHHYTCFTTEDSCNSVNYIHTAYDSNYQYYIVLENGTKIDTAIEQMQANTTSSTIKTKIDNWYKSNMIKYTNYLEDTVWCNDRSIDNYGGWAKDGDASDRGKYGDTPSYLIYSPYKRNKPNINCSNKNDAFTVSEENGNGALTYPTATLTVDEIRLAGIYGSNTNNYLYTNKDWWLLSPRFFTGSINNHFKIDYNGSISSSSTEIYLYITIGEIRHYIGIRPSISLKPGIRTDSGDDTPNDPYTLELDES